jgi:stigma-specific protein Stig1
MRTSSESGSVATFDALARDLAGGRLSRRQAVGGLVSAVAGVWVLRPAQALGMLRAKCAPSHRCGKDCCGHGERCRTHSGHHKCVCKRGLRRCHGKCVNTDSDVHNCGACGNLCESGQVCSHGTCKTKCATGLTNCGGSCVDVQTDADNCGGCGNVCAGNATGVNCSAGTCSYTCASGFADCDQTAPNLNGCETQLNTIQNCGACGAACDTLTSNGTSCNGTTCLYTSCQPGYADCNSTAPNLGGCDTAINTAQNCGACGAACDTAHSNGATCTQTGCHYTSCKPGYADCNSTAPNLSGCETPTTTTQNCGGCGNVCGGTHVQTKACVGGIACSYTCQPGYVDCDQSGANTNGCECAGTGCCSGACQTAHSNGLGQTFYDCTAAGTYNLTQANEARAAWTVAGTDTIAPGCGTGAVARQAFDRCAVWVYSGGGAGHVYLNTIDNTCLCPTASDPTWT